MILTQQQIEGLRERHARVDHAHGYPTGMITDLLQTLMAEHKEKKKWQRLAERRGEALKKVKEIVDRVAAPMVPEEENL